ncbi:MAG TPA: 50S ribosomal protein L35 [Spirochaetes bacterium]|nr:50S ribosomal protein L35 [Spirochaetota bacterium]
MPKLKTKKGASKRFKVTKNGKIKRKKAYRGHILTKKSSKRKRNLRKPEYVSSSEKKTVNRMLPYS